MGMIVAEEVYPRTTNFMAVRELMHGAAGGRWMDLLAGNSACLSHLVRNPLYNVPARTMFLIFEQGWAVNVEQFNWLYWHDF